MESSASIWSLLSFIQTDEWYVFFTGYKSQKIKKKKAEIKSNDRRSVQQSAQRDPFDRVELSVTTSCDKVAVRHSA